MGDRALKTVQLRVWFHTGTIQGRAEDVLEVELEGNETEEEREALFQEWFDDWLANFDSGYSVVGED